MGNAHPDVTVVSNQWFAALEAEGNMEGQDLGVDGCAVRVLVGDAVVEWRGSAAEEGVLLSAIHAVATCIGDACCRLPDISMAAGCAAHDLLCSQAALDVFLILIRANPGIAS